MLPLSSPLSLLLPLLRLLHLRQQEPQLLRGLVSIELGGGDRKSQALPFHRIRLRFDAIEAKEN